MYMNTFIDPHIYGGVLYIYTFITSHIYGGVLYMCTSLVSHIYGGSLVHVYRLSCIYMEKLCTCIH